MPIRLPPENESDQHLTDPKLKTAIDYAQSMVGKTPSDQDLRDYLKGTLDPRKHDWCTAFLNATLKKAGIAGTPSMMATSFLAWGRHVDPKDVRAGDVIVTGEDDEGPRPGGLGHAAIVTGPIHKGTRPGQQDSDYVPTISGNWSHRVKAADVLADEGTAEFRRAPPSHRAQTNILHRTSKHHPGEMHDISGDIADFAPSAPKPGSGGRPRPRPDQMRFPPYLEESIEGISQAPHRIYEGARETVKDFPERYAAGYKKVNRAAPGAMGAFNRVIGAPLMGGYEAVAESPAGQLASEISLSGAPLELPPRRIANDTARAIDASHDMDIRVDEGGPPNISFKKVFSENNSDALDVHVNDNKVASILVTKDGSDLHIDNIFGGGAGSLGTSTVRDIQKSLGQLYPGITTVSGYRGTGARAQTGNKGKIVIHTRAHVD